MCIRDRCTPGTPHLGFPCAIRHLAGGVQHHAHPGGPHGVAEPDEPAARIDHTLPLATELSIGDPSAQLLGGTQAQVMQQHEGGDAEAVVQLHHVHGLLRVPPGALPCLRHRAGDLRKGQARACLLYTSHAQHVVVVHGGAQLGLALAAQQPGVHAQQYREGQRPADGEV